MFDRVLDGRSLTDPHSYPLILREVLHWAPHVVCLQEVEHFAELQRDLEQHGYEGLYLQRTGDRNDGCATFWCVLCAGGVIYTCITGTVTRLPWWTTSRCSWTPID